MTATKWLRLALGYLALQDLQIGLWALLAPQSFYDGFPAPGRGWISVDGPFNEHLIRDVGALHLGLVVLFVWAAVSLNPNTIRASSGAALAWGVPHLIYHLFSGDGLSAGDQLALVGGLVLFAALPVVNLFLVRSLDEQDATLEVARR